MRVRGSSTVSTVARSLLSLALERPSSWRLALCRIAVRTLASMLKCSAPQPSPSPQPLPSIPSFTLLASFCRQSKQPVSAGTHLDSCYTTPCTVWRVAPWKTGGLLQGRWATSSWREPGAYLDVVRSWLQLASRLLVDRCRLSVGMVARQATESRPSTASLQTTCDGVRTLSVCVHPTSLVSYSQCISRHLSNFGQDTQD